MSFLTLPLLLFALSSLSLAVDPIHIPLTRRLTSSQPFDPIKEAYKVKVKYDFIDESSLLRRGTSAGIPVINQARSASHSLHQAKYQQTFVLNFRAQTFTIVLDTGSSDLWFASTSCQICRTNAPLFQTAISQSFRASTDPGVTITYASGAVKGAIGSDKVTMGGFTISSQTFVVVDSATSDILQATPFWQALLNDKKFSSPDMGFWLAKASPSSKTTEVPGGVFTLGGTNSSLYSGSIDFQKLPMSTPSFWLQNLTVVTVGGRSVQIASGLSAIDTGTTLIVGPSTDVAAIWAAVPNSSPSEIVEGFFRFPCTAHVNMSLSFGGKAWPITPQDMNIGPETTGSSFCLGAINTMAGAVSGPGLPSWIIGDTFLKNVYTVFRASPPSVGFAQLSTLAGGTGGPSSVSVIPCN
ncbi:aspartic peptidase domain-containing protein [Gymnopilus junonius]|uniref:Aspartic peptidase domain-containing protein n=1 Tax=Gymnopilus junonius TaxID=109634 RepID=A0A9P5TLI6_GYMJU|nr:aspartic peptidase domain-containing protein [Gymnopilus junonius]